MGEREGAAAAVVDGLGDTVHDDVETAALLGSVRIV